MSGSFSNSASFSSSQAIIAHFDEAAGTLAEGGYSITNNAIDSIVQALRDETIDQISFWGMCGHSDEGKALLRIKIDWAMHAVIVEEGDRVELPMQNGTISLQQVQRAALAFLRAYQEKGLQARISLRYRPEEQYRADALNERYGWIPGSVIKMSGSGAGFELPSRYHKGVSLEQWYAD